MIRLRIVGITKGMEVGAAVASLCSSANDSWTEYGAKPDEVEKGVTMFQDAIRQMKREVKENPDMYPEIPGREYWIMVCDTEGNPVRKGAREISIPDPRGVLEHGHGFNAKRPSSKWDSFVALVLDIRFSGSTSG